jgi:hypothetical protein
MTIEPMIDFMGEKIKIITVVEGSMMMFGGILTGFDANFIYIESDGDKHELAAINISKIVSITTGDLTKKLLPDILKDDEDDGTRQ